MRRAVAPALLLAALSVAGCSSGADGSAPTTTVPAPSIPAADRSPGNPDAPQWCTVLGGSTSLPALAAVLPRYVEGSANAADATTMAQASAELMSLSGATGVQSATAKSFTAAARALDSLRARPDDATAVTAVSTSFTSLDGQVQQACAFPLG